MKVEVFVQNEDGSHNRYHGYIPQGADPFKVIQDWATVGVARIERGKYDLMIPWTRVVHVKVPKP